MKRDLTPSEMARVRTVGPFYSPEPHITRIVRNSDPDAHVGWVCAVAGLVLIVLFAIGAIQ